MVDRRRRVIWSASAAEALDSAAEHLAADAPLAAARLVERVLAAADSLQRLATRGRRVAEIPDPAGRQLMVHPFRLIYRVQDAEVHILATMHQARDVEALRGSPGP